jgi:hypothetical protein
VTCIWGHPAGTGDANFDLSSSNVLSGFSTDFLISMGGYHAYARYGPATNVFLERLEAYGIGDVVYANAWQGLRAEDCTFVSKSDCFVDFQRDPSGTNAIAELYNCHFKTEGAGELSNHGIGNGGKGQIRLYGGSVEAKNARYSACVWSPPGTPEGGSIELSGVALTYGTTNAAGRAYAILNESGNNCRIVVRGMLVKVADVAGAIEYDGNILSTNVVEVNSAGGF